MRRIIATSIISICLTASALAAEPVPGSSCSGYTTNSWQWAGAPQNSGVLNGMFCNGTTWTGLINLQATGTVMIGPSGIAADTDATAYNSFSGTSFSKNLILSSKTAGDALQIAIGVPDGTRNQRVGFFYNDTTQFWGLSNDYSTGGHPTFVIRNDDSESLRIVDGYVGIGTTNPQAALHVAGDIKYTGSIQDVSDRRLKRDIQPLPHQLGTLLQLEPVSFIMKDDKTGRPELGLIAQDVEPLYPELVSTGQDGTKSMNYIGLIAPMISVIKEQQAEIDALKTANDELSRRLDAQARTIRYQYRQ